MLKKSFTLVAASCLLVSGGALALAAKSDTETPSGYSSLRSTPGASAPPDGPRADLERVTRDARARIPDRNGVLAIAEGRATPTHIQHPSGVSITVLRAGATMCVTEDLGEVGGMGCGPAPEHIAPGRPPISVTLIAEGTYRVTAVVPDGTTSAVVDDDNEVTRLQVADNVASEEVRGTPRGFRLTDAEGRTHVQRLSGASR